MEWSKQDLLLWEEYVPVKCFQKSSSCKKECCASSCFLSCSMWFYYISPLALLWITQMSTAKQLRALLPNVLTPCGKEPSLYVDTAVGSFQLAQVISLPFGTRENTSVTQKVLALFSILEQLWRQCKQFCSCLDRTKLHRYDLECWKSQFNLPSCIKKGDSGGKFSSFYYLVPAGTSGIMIDSRAGL